MGNKQVATADLEPYYLADTNRKIVNIPVWLYLYFLGEYYFNKPFIEQSYHKVTRTYDKQLAAAINNPKKYQRLEAAKKQKLQHYENLLAQGNLLMQLGEAPCLYSAEKRKQTERNMLQYLYTQGFFNAKVTSAVKIKQQTAYVRYIIQENEPWILREITLNTPDEAIKSILEPYTSTSLLQVGQRYNQELLEQERDRIHALLLNHGYWGFKKNYIWFNVDNTSQDKTVFIETVVALPAEANAHPAYQIDQIDFTILGEDASTDDQTSTLFHDITFKNTTPYCAPKVLITKIPFKKGDVYSAKTTIALQKRLIALGIFKTIHVAHIPIDQQRLQTHIQATLLDKFQLEHEVGAEITRHSYRPLEHEVGADSTGHSCIPHYQSTLKIRNLFHQLDSLSTSLQFGIELGSLATDGSPFYNVNNFATNINWQIPTLFLPLPNNLQHRLAAYEPVTKLNIGYKFADHPNYKSHNINQGITVTTRFTHMVLDIAPLNIRLIDYAVKPAFKTELEQRKQEGDITYKKYDPLLDTNMAIKAMTRDPEGDKRKTIAPYSYWEIAAESGGTAQNFINIEKLLRYKFACYRYLKGKLKYIYHLPLHARTMLAFQYSTGILYPYSKSRIAPQDKYFFMGGLSSIRAWGSKTLGPGSSPPNPTPKQQYVNEREGELLIQFNAELRQRIVGILEGAIFLDTGNIWMLSKKAQAGVKFAWSRFYKELAVGTGVGIRLNFNVLVLLLDIGIKIYDPSSPAGARLFPRSMWEQPTFNVGLGYPF